VLTLYAILSLRLAVLTIQAEPPAITGELVDTALTPRGAFKAEVKADGTTYTCFFLKRPGRRLVPGMEVSVQYRVSMNQTNLYDCRISKIISVPIEAMSARRLVKAYENNEVKADRLYKGVRLKVYGKVASVGKDIRDKPYVVLVDSDSSSFGRVQCYFDKEDELAKLNKNQRLTIEGTGAGLGLFGNVLLTDCKIERR